MSKLFFLLFFFPILGLAQLEQPKRFETELEGYDNEFEIMVGGTSGVILYRTLNQYNKKGGQLWDFVSLDTALNIKWQKQVYLEKNLDFKGYDFSMDSYFFLFQKTSGNSRDLKLMQMMSATGDTLRYTIKNLVPLILTEFEVTNGAAILGGNYNSESVVIHFSLIDNKTKVLPGIFGSKVKLVQLKVDNNSITVLVSERTFDKRNTLTIKRYSIDGDYLSTHMFNPDFDKGLIFGRIADVEDITNLVVGTYGAKKSDYSQGLFLGLVDNEETQQKIEYINYADFENFFNYMKAKRQKRVSDRIDRKKIKGKKVKFNYRLLVHSVFKQDDTYILLGEAFYPKYSSSNYYNRSTGHYAGYDSGSNDQLPMNFAGYRYTHGIVAAFDSNGKMLWDNSFEIEDVLSYSLEQFIHAAFVEEGIVLLYLYDNQIRSKIISGAEVIEGKKFDDLKLSFEDDKVNNYSSNKIGGLEKWYGNTFVAYGVQRIKNLQDSGVKLNRKVFYVNKVIYH
ncbi:MAG: hypothetical protein L3J29_03125 [Cyclobacteriaceae bacterium]|nr:hypothetical protein [Cyclobacteriaceae bacterium]